MAPSFDGLYRAIAQALTNAGLPVDFVDVADWRERERMLLAREADLGFICGLPYVREADRPDPAFTLLAAPVLAAPRYENRPIYFSDVIVRADSAFRTLEDLRGARWAFNDEGSHSGRNLPAWALARRGERGGYFREVVESGAHQESIRMVLDAQVDGAAIDSTVLELAMRREPPLGRCLRVVESLGPSPIPPAVVSTRVPSHVRDRLRDLLLTLDGPFLAEHGVARFVAVSDGDYDPVRRIAAEADGVQLAKTQSRRVG